MSLHATVGYSETGCLSIVFSDWRAVPGPAFPSIRRHDLQTQQYLFLESCRAVGGNGYGRKNVREPKQTDLRNYELSRSIGLVLMEILQLRLRLGTGLASTADLVHFDAPPRRVQSQHHQLTISTSATVLPAGKALAISELVLIETLWQMPTRPCDSVFGAAGWLTSSSSGRFAASCHPTPENDFETAHRTVHRPRKFFQS